MDFAAMAAITHSQPGRDDAGIWFLVK